ncbi:MAG: pentapeptide repeat-containing protein [Aureliella sp.]
MEPTSARPLAHPHLPQLPSRLAGRRPAWGEHGRRHHHDAQRRRRVGHRQSHLRHRSPAAHRYQRHHHAAPAGRVRERDQRHAASSAAGGNLPQRQHADGHLGDHRDDAPRGHRHRARAVRNTHLRGADLRSAYLWHADLRSADLRRSPTGSPQFLVRGGCLAAVATGQSTAD